MYRKAFFFIVLLSAVLVTLMPKLKPGYGEQDFLAYWSSAHLFVTGGNPYDPDSLGSIESSVDPEFDRDEGVGLQVWNPPWLLMILFPIGMLPFPIAVKVWIVTNVVLIGLTLVVLWSAYLNAGGKSGFVYVLGAGFIFSSTLTLIGLGQITTLVLISLILGVWLLGSGHFLLGGFLLLFTTVKPHLSYFVLLMIFVWVIRNRHWKVFLGMFLGILVSVIIVSILLPNWLTSYFQLLNNFPYRQVDTTTLGAFMAYEFNLPYFNLAGLLLIPLIFPLQRSLDRKDWLSSINIALLISLPLSPYGFSFDHILLIPAITQIVFWILNKELSYPASLLIALLIIFIYTLSFVIWLFVDVLPYHMGIWQPLALGITYGFAWLIREKSVGKLQPAM